MPRQTVGRTLTLGPITLKRTLSRWALLVHSGECTSIGPVPLAKPRFRAHLLVAHTHSGHQIAFRQKKRGNRHASLVPAVRPSGCRVLVWLLGNDGSMPLYFDRGVKKTGECIALYAHYLSLLPQSHSWRVNFPEPRIISPNISASTSPQAISICRR